MPARLALAALLAVSLLPGAARADCAAGDLSCLDLPEVPARPAHLAASGMMSSASTPEPLVAVGEVLPRGEYSIILNADYYGLPPVSDGWVYMRVERDVFRVDWQSQQVLERVTDQAAANF